jgi:hypothetical protein
VCMERGWLETCGSDCVVCCSLGLRAALCVCVFVCVCVCVPGQISGGPV